MKYLFLALLFFGFFDFSFVFGQEDDKLIQDFRKQFNDIKTDTAKLIFINNIENKIAYFQNPVLLRRNFEFY